MARLKREQEAAAGSSAVGAPVSPRQTKAGYEGKCICAERLRFGDGVVDRWFTAVESLKDKMARLKGDQDASHVTPAGVSPRKAGYEGERCRAYCC